jgi:hypothetical protein
MCESVICIPFRFQSSTNTLRLATSVKAASRSLSALIFASLATTEGKLLVAMLGALLGAREGSKLGSVDGLSLGAVDGWTEGLELG